MTFLWSRAASFVYCGLRLGKAGESTFVAFQLYLAMTILKEFAQGKQDTGYIAYLDEQQAKLEKTM